MPTIPRADEYQAAVQNPSTSFGDPELQKARVETDHLGLPRVASGEFALTYRMRDASRAWAVRCFYKDVPHLRRRYEAISSFLRTNSSPIFVAVKYEQDGIRVAGRFQPIIKMPWVAGDPLGVHVEANLIDPSKLQPLPAAFRALVSQLQRLGVAHGDLQHGNIMVDQGQLRLIDYDGFYVPGLSGLPSSNLGHVNYQHPQRQISDFGPDLDRFSAIVIYLGLHSTCLRPALWRTYATGENCLFSQGDFTDPDNSRLIADLRQIPELQPLLDSFRSVCFLPFSAVPTLEDFLQARVAKPVSIATIPPVPVRHQYPQLDAADSLSLVRHQGQRVEVLGIVIEVAWKSTRGNRPYVFLSFGDWHQKCFRLVLWEDTLKRFIQAGVDPKSFAHRQVLVTGVVSVYQGTPQIIVEMPSEVHAVQAAPSVVTLRTAARRSTSTPPAPSVPSKSTSGRSSSSADDVLNRLYGGYPSFPTPISKSPPSPPPPVAPAVPIQKQVSASGSNSPSPVNPTPVASKPSSHGKRGKGRLARLWAWIIYGTLLVVSAVVVGSQFGVGALILYLVALLVLGRVLGVRI